MVAKRVAKQLVNGLVVIGVVWSLLLFNYAHSAVMAQSSEVALTAPKENRLIELINSPIGQQIPVADERFRIDYAVEEVTLAFFRDPDTAPVVITLPDGSKWYANRHPEDKVRWSSGHDYDIIRVAEPMPGPWQVSGRIRPESRVIVVSDIEFHPAPFPPLVFYGEQLKLTGQLTQGGKEIDQRDFRSVIRLELFFQSTNNPQYDNFGQPQVRVGEFLDDGKQMDETPRDGVFTGQFNLDLAEGEYVPRYQVKTPLHERSFEANPILVRRAPVRSKVVVAGLEGEAHELTFEVDEEFIDINDIVIHGRISYPNGERQDLAISTAQGDSLVLVIPNYTFGVFEIRANLSATDKYGREFQAEIPYNEFRSQRLRETAPSQAQRALIAAAAEQAKLHNANLEAVAAERKSLQTRIIWVVAVNLVIVGIWGLFMLLRSNKPKPTKKLKKQKRKKAKKDKQQQAAAVEDKQDKK